MEIVKIVLDVAQVVLLAALAIMLYKDLRERKHGGDK